MAVGNAAARRVHRAFEDAGNGRGIERRGNKNGAAREGELADVRRRCRKKKDMSRGHVQRRRQCDRIQQDNQLTQTNRGGSRMDMRGGCATKGDARRRQRNKR